MEARMHVLGTLLTCTTYGSWLRGDQRGWVDQGRVLPPDPIREANDSLRLEYPPYLFTADSAAMAKQAIVSSLQQRLNAKVLAITVKSWHVHFVVGMTPHNTSVLVKCAKDAVRYVLRPNRPIWTEGYDKRFCFDEQALHARIEYVERHNLDRHPPNPFRAV